MDCPLITVSDLETLSGKMFAENSLREFVEKGLLPQSHPNLRESIDALFQRILELEDAYDREADVGRLNSRVQSLESELKEYLCEYFFDVSDLKDDGWWVTNATTSSVQAGDRLVELGVLEKDPNRGTGRVQFYKVIES